MPPPTLGEKVQKGEVILGGCAIDLGSNQPSWRCSQCNTPLHKTWATSIPDVETRRQYWPEPPRIQCERACPRFHCRIRGVCYPRCYPWVDWKCLPPSLAG